MRPRLATVVSTRPWERHLVAAVRSTGLARSAGRHWRHDRLERSLARIDVVAFDTTAPWIDADVVARWRSRGLITVGFGSSGDRTAHRVLAECDLVFGDDTAPGRVLAAVVATAPPAPSSTSGGRVTPVIGGRGAPGCTEVAIALAALLAEDRDVLLTESDPAAPGIGLRLAVPPDAGVARVAGFHVLPAAPTAPGTERALRRAARACDHVVVDAGASGPTGPDPGTAVLVVNPSPAGVVRAARLLRAWNGVAPVVVVNRAPPDGPDRWDGLRRVRAATGLDPSAVVGQLAIGWPAPPAPAMVDALRPLVEAICGQPALR